GDDADYIAGGGGNDTITAGYGDDIVHGAAGNDAIIGGFGDDNLYGGLDNDTLTGAAGDDQLFGSHGDDTLYGGGDADELTGGVGGDYLDGGDGVDEARYTTSSVGVTVDLLNGTASGGDAAGDTLVDIENLFGSGNDDTFIGDAGSNSLNGFNGNDILQGGAGADILFGGYGSDTADYSDSSVAVDVRLHTSTGVGGTADGDTLLAMENVIGSDYGDFIQGMNGTNVLTGGDGNDTLNGLNGNDTLYGGEGEDVLIGGKGYDVLDGGGGIDTARYTNSDGLIRINLETGFTSGAGHAFGDTLVSIENIVGSIYNDVITGDANTNVLDGYNGNDKLDGGEGDDTLTGGTGNDTFVFTKVLFGDDVITDFDDGVDMLDFTALGLDETDFTIAQAGADTVLTLISDPGQTVTLLGVTATTIDASDFV
ncbi:MAG: calcium-binding protein, partial [Ilumatobacter sp.]|nr:calcium-binding protein [Ilumatobacter sp.]